jgi:MFS family permease
MSQNSPRPARSELYPWFAWSLGALFFAYSFFQRTAPSIMVADLMRDFSVSAAILGNLSAFYFYAYACMQIPVGVMVDRWGTRRIMAVGAVMCGVGTLMFATADTLPPAYFGRLLLGAGAGVACVCTLNLVSTRFPPARFALLTGLTSMMGVAGAVAGQAPYSFAVAAHGWRNSQIAAAVFALLLAALIWMVVRDNARPAAVPGPQGTLLRGLGQVLRNPQAWITGLFGAMITASQSTFAALWCVPFMMQAHGLERPAAAASASLMMVGWGIGAPLMGWFSDRIQRRKTPMMLGSGVALLSFVVLVYLPGLPLVAVQALILLHGISAASMIIGFAMIREHSPPETAGAAMGFQNTANMLSGAMLQPVVGWILDLNWDGRMAAGGRVYSPEAFQAAFLPLAACGLLAFLAALAVRESHISAR